MKLSALVHNQSNQQHPAPPSIAVPAAVPAAAANTAIKMMEVYVNPLFVKFLRSIPAFLPTCFVS